MRELIDNMRQAKDKEYADIMKRIRIGSPSDEDIKALLQRMISVLNKKRSSIKKIV